MEDDEIKLIYSVKYIDIQIFGKIFVHNNKNKCKIIHKEQIYELTEEFHAVLEDELEIKLQ